METNPLDAATGAAKMTRLLALTLLAGTAYAKPCAVQVVIDLTTYEGPKHYQNFCLSEPALYGNGLLSVEAVSMGDGIFKNGFDP